MTQRQPTIWMNMTTSANWHRPPVGIVRVEQSLNSELSKLYGNRFKQCVWLNDEFVEWNPKAPEPHKPEATTKQTATLSPIFPLLPKKQALIAIGQGFLSLLPGKIRPYFNRFLHYLRPRVVRFITREKRKKNKPMALSPTPIPSQKRPNLDSGRIFSPGDIFISIGLDWDYQYYKNFYYLRKDKNIKVITCCYDLIPVIYPQYCVGEVANLFESYFLDISDGSDVVLCISEQSKKDFLSLMNRTGGGDAKTHVFPLGDNVPFINHEEISNDVKKICEEPFILFVSTIERRKNHEVLYRAYHLLCAEGKRNQLPKLIFVGMQGWGTSELFKDIELDPLTRGLIIRVNHVTDAELRALYDAAKFCVYPSLYEGWGLPVGEALSLGKVVLASNRGSLPEVGGDLVLYIDPWHPRAWSDEIYRMATDHAWRTEWQDKIKNNYQSRTWAMSAATVKTVIDGDI